MSAVNVPIYRTEAGVNNAVAISASYNTHCFDGSSRRKLFREVLILYSGGVWVEQASYVSGSVVALRVDNPCTGQHAYIAMGYNDFRLLQLCCVSNCPSNPIPEDLVLPNGQVGVPYDVDIQLLGSGPFNALLSQFPGWMVLEVDEQTGIVNLSGDPNIADDTYIVEIQVANCGNELDPLVFISVNPFTVDPA